MTNSSIQTFNFKGNQVRTIDIDNQTWFVAMDIAEIMQYKDTEAMTRKLDAIEIQNLQIVGFGNRGVNLINESGLYSVILTSQKLEAKAFKLWIIKEVLPSIRKTGSYNQPKDFMSEMIEIQTLLLRPDPRSFIPLNIPTELYFFHYSMRSRHDAREFQKMEETINPLFSNYNDNNCMFIPPRNISPGPVTITGVINTEFGPHWQVNQLKIPMVDYWLVRSSHWRDGYVINTNDAMEKALYGYKSKLLKLRSELMTAAGLLDPSPAFDPKLKGIDKFLDPLYMEQRIKNISTDLIKT